jgi:hypothetical protein
MPPFVHISVLRRGLLCALLATSSAFVGCDDHDHDHSEAGHSHDGHGDAGHSHGGHGDAGHSHGGHGDAGHGDDGHSHGGHGDDGHSHGGHGGDGHSHGGHGDDGHSHGGHGDDGHSLGGHELPSATVDAACLSVEPDESAASPAPSLDAETPLLVVADGTPRAYVAPTSGVARLAFRADTDHGDWRVLVGVGATLEAISGPGHAHAPSQEVTDERCTSRWAQMASLHIHDLGIWEVHVGAAAGSTFLFAVALEGSGH